MTARLPLVIAGTTIEEIQTGDTYNLANGASLPLATGVSGTLPTANGGTNLTTFTSGGAVYASSTSVLATGTLPVASGGTGITSFGTGVATWLGTPSSANLATAMTDETGSGSLVFGTSPTIGTAALTNPTVTNYVETLYSVTGSATLALTNGTVQKVTTSGSTTITLPSSVSGKSFTVIVSYAAADSITWAGGSTLKWAGGTTPTPTSATGKIDVFNFYQDGTNTYGSIFGQNF